MTAFFHSHHNLPFALSGEEMSNEAFPFLYHHGQAEAIPSSSSSDQPRSRTSSISDANGAHHHMEKKKRSLNESWLSSVKSKETNNGRNKKLKEPVEEERKKKGEGKEPPLGYIHVRARRGQATDSHSLAERVRREKISERMKVLQGLVPGCEKVVGKALMLDEIINYVQSLQNQVEFLSMKLACANPVLFDSVDYDCLVNQAEIEVVGSMPVSSSLLHSSIIQPTPKAYEALISPPPELLQRQGPLPLSQENGSLFMQVGDQRSQELINYITLNNMCSFQ